MLFSATMGTKVDDLIKLSLKRPVRVAVTDKKRKGGAVGADMEVEVAHRLEQEFVRVRANNEGIPREAMLLSLLTRTFTNQTIAFFDTKAAAHRLMIVCGLCGIKCAELHGNLTQTQRLEALEAFRGGEVDVLLATDLAARGLDISGVDAVINFEMPSNVETYVHRIGRTARAGRAGSACTLIGEGRRHLMKAVIRDATEKSRRAAEKSKGGASEAAAAGVIRSRTIPPAVVSHFTAKVASLDPHIEEVLAAEAVARMDRITEMEMTRVKNIIQHGDEIKARPKKEWFASNEQKTSVKEATAEKQRKIDEAVGTGKHRMTRKKRRAREAKEDMLHYQEELREEQEETGRNSKKGLVTDQIMKTSARAQKRDAAKKGVGAAMSVHDEDMERKRKHKAKEQRDKKKRKGAFATDTLGAGGLFDEEKVAFSKKDKTDDGKRPSSYNFTEFDPSQMGKKGKKKGNKAFKSKAKHKRR
uniref:Helicase C-terminal domain-containing protein n=2 Tax=Odontella aurita TaxID=265563 RepID=A0A7S4KB23_9STRA|mmetsp:Transcript_8430/g.25514  ORF Transcript_8430/g.25514 Transcript_8430/m.25514 type:complete len:473 (+) Transcript_8430:369-1787(+)